MGKKWDIQPQIFFFLPISSKFNQTSFKFEAVPTLPQAELSLVPDVTLVIIVYNFTDILFVLIFIIM